VKAAVFLAKFLNNLLHKSCYLSKKIYEWPFFSHSHQIFYWITYNCLFPPLDRRSLLHKQPFITAHFNSSL